MLGARESIPTQKGVAHPKCPRRRARTFLAEIEPDGVYDKRTFECVECGNVLTKVVKIQIGAEPRLGTTQFFLGICELNEEDEGICYNSRFVFALGFAFGYGARAAVYLFRARRRLSFKIYAISALKTWSGPRRWIGRLRLHARKYILGITAPTGTGVQA